MTLTAPKRRFLEWLQRLAKRRVSLYRGDGLYEAGMLVRISVTERGRCVVQLKQHQSTREFAADWPSVVGGSVEVNTPEALGALMGEVWHALHEKANGWETDERPRAQVVGPER